jgi:cystathionine gamma-synthase
MLVASRASLVIPSTSRARVALRFYATKFTPEDKKLLTPEEAGRKAEMLAGSSPVKMSELSSLLSHAGIESQTNNPMAPPLHLASTYTRPADGVYNETDSIYSRMDNKTRLLLERVVYEMETHGLDDQSVEPTTFAFSSGMMAASSIILAHNTPISIIFPKDLYHGVPTVAVDVFGRHNVEVEHVDMSQISEVTDALSRVTSSQAIVWMETPSNPLCQVVDIQGVCDAVRSASKAAGRSVTIVVDSTLAPPVLTQALQYGPDLVMHSGTKYLAGHSDVLLGLVTASPVTERGRELAPLLRQTQIATGGVASPFDAWLCLRGLRTLCVRVERICQSALEVAKFLDAHPMVTKVHYPGLSTHPQHKVAARQMKNGFGGVLSFELENATMATAVAGALKMIQRATSLGGTETLIEHRASIEPPGRVTSPQGLLRLSVGLEDQKDIIRDLDNALSIADQVVSEGRV